MNCYVINLDRSTDRFAHISRLLAGSRLVRVSAVDGDRLPADELAGWLARNRIWAPMSAREIGCFLSHRKTWKLIVEADEPWAFVCEDDVHFSGDATRFLASADWLPAEGDIVKAETMRKPVEMSVEKTAEAFGHTIRRLKSEHLGSAGYFVSRRGCERLLELTAERCEPADRALFSPEGGIAPLLDIHQIDPALCIQDFHLARRNAGAGFASEIPVERNVKLPRKGFGAKARKLWREIRRPAGQLADAMRRFAVRLGGGVIVKSVPIDLSRQ